MRDLATIEPDSEAAGLHMGGAPRRQWRGGLASRVVLLIIAIVAVAVIAIYVPIVTNYRDNWFRNRLSAAYTATLVLAGTPSRELLSHDALVQPDDLAQQLLDAVGARIIVLKMRGTRRIVAEGKLPSHVDEVYDLRHAMFPRALASTLRTFVAPDDRVITVLGDAPWGAEAIEVTFDEAPLKEA